MKASPNLFGQAVTDYFNGQVKGPFLICDETDEYEVDLGFFLSEVPTHLETQALTCVRGKILDVGCGPGRILKFLQSRGHNATGFDIDPLTVRLCEKRGCTDVVVESYCNLARFAPADTVLWLNRTLCTGGTISQIKTLLLSSREICSPDGIVILESYKVSPNMCNRGDGVRQNTLHFRYGDKIGEQFIRTFFSSGVAISMLQETGWTDIEILRDDDIYIAIARNGGQFQTDH